MLNIISQISTLLGPIPIAIRTSIITGDVNGISLSQKDNVEEGSSMTEDIIDKAKIIGIVNGTKNCCVSVSSSTAAPIAAIIPA